MASLPASGPAAALLAAALFGISAPLAKELTGAIDPWLLAGLLYLGSGLGLGLAWLWRRRGGHGREGRLARRHLPWLAAAIASGGVVAPVLLVLGLVRTDGATGALLLNLEAVATAALAWLVVREHTSLRLVLGLLLIVAGGAALAWPEAAGAAAGGGWGPPLIAAACLCWGIDNTCTRPLSECDPVAVAALKGLVAGTVNTAIAFALGAVLPAPTALAGALLVGVAGYGISLVLFLLALRRLGSGRTGAYFAIAPFVGALAAFALGASPSWPLAVAGALMGLGVWLHLGEQHEHEHHHHGLDHDHRHRHDDDHHRHPHRDGDLPGPEHSHPHRHEDLRHRHPHLPDLHHRHAH
jgi:drug/metabolite transporter (DMT)-like permease